ncbi:MAG TPA: sarcosine oxidase subunit delta [Gemmataceae bacterium]|jgi:sarcosine oxidase subunit delta|nr:sarcosine oxidase subunit delta [Gemmataceae bacterium]
MSFILTCPNCGAREVNEFRYGGEITAPSAASSNQPGLQKERWFHRFGCRRWLMAERDVRTNSVVSTAWLEGEAT